MLQLSEAWSRVLARGRTIRAAGRFEEPTDVDDLIVKRQFDKDYLASVDE